MIQEVVTPSTMYLVDRMRLEGWVVEEWWIVGGVYPKVFLLGM